jgi:hypothetical protein
MTEKKKIFLLGGYDLEMIEIKALCETAPNVEVIDKHLTWGALLSAYQDELKRYADGTKYEIYGIELGENDLQFVPPDNYHSIDHHNGREDEPAAIEQTVALLNIKLNDYHRLVAANDSGYIPAMERTGASREQIDEIRRRDRAAQGVTAEDEQKAKKSVAENLQQYGDLLVVKSETPRFSPLCDLLFPYEKLLIYTDKELVYYGKGKNLLVEHFHKEIAEGKMYHGGGDKGYFGISNRYFSKDKINEIINIIKKQ